MADYIILIAVAGLAVLFLLLKRREKNSRMQDSGGPSAASFWPEINLSLRQIIVAAIIALVILWGYYSFGPENRSYKFSSQEEFNRHWTCSGTCTVAGGSVNLWGTMFLKETPDFGAIEVVPSTQMDALTIMVGPYIFDYYKSQYDLLNYKSDKDLYHRGHIWYGVRSRDTSLDYVDIPVLVVQGAPLAIKVSSSWWNQFFDGHLKGGDPTIEIEGRTIASGLRSKSNTPLPIQGTISVYGEGVKINEVKIYHHTLLKRLGINI